MQAMAHLVAAAQRGDQAAFAELVRRYERVVVMTAWAVLRDFHAAQDTAQESFVIAYRALNSLRHPEAFGSWLLKTTHREAIRRSRRRNSDLPLDSIAEPAAENMPPEWQAAFEAVAPALSRLPAHEREVIVFRYVDGLSVNDIATATDRPLGTVTKQISRALQRLRDVLTGIES